MAGLMASTATGVLGSVIDELAAMLTDKYNLATDVKQGIRFLRDELSTMDAVLRVLADKDDDHIHPLAKDWRSKVRELSYDIEDCVDRFVLNHSHGDGGSTANFVHKFFDFFQKETRDLVGIDAPREEIISLLRCEDKEHKVVSIYGIGGQGKTTLAREVQKITEAAFDSRAFVSVSQIPDMKEILRDILSQISKSHFDRSQELDTVEQLIRTVKECLKDKR
ncbi:unnamed protein product [Miscanthus lutarioriparius]|uniref:Uncharacterized protein n=1 Tax=Miscanthus lutarioriparius TaxID=422564 RepID=A0A811QKY5_9POAL|nr:unnamed protein product [Miscanthus lutarioriparius]